MSAKNATDAQAAHEVEEKELKRKTTINEKEPTTSETAEKKSEPFSLVESESKDKGKDFLSDAESLKSIVIDEEFMTFGGNSDDVRFGFPSSRR